MSVSSMVIVGIGAFLVGVSKSGLKGLGILIVALLALEFGARQSTGILLPMLVIGDVLAVIYYKRHTRWIYLKKFLPAMVFGVLMGVWIGADLPEESFNNWMGSIILVSVALMWWWDWKGKETIPDNWGLAVTAGVAAGFTTMIGNLAGAFANMFFLATRMPKNEIIGTSAWLFFIINIFKLPFHVWVWGTVTVQTLMIDLTFLPIIIIGFFVGKKIVAYINERYYRYFLLVATAIGAFAILLK